VKILILGAGPTGLTLGNILLDNNYKDFTILEANPEVGGLCRTVYISGIPVDVGGGHFLDKKNEIACNFIFRFLPKSEWNEFSRSSKIFFKGKEIGYPFESSIWELDIKDQIRIIKSLITSGSQKGEKKPKKFIDWINWKLGTEIANDYMIPYNKKMFGDNLDLLGTYWLDKLPNVSIDEILESSLNKKNQGTAPAHSNFYYPKKFGYGEVWLRMGNRLNNHIILNTRVDSINIKNKLINNKYKFDLLISTIPLTNLKNNNFPFQINKILDELKHTSVRIDYFDELINTKAQWVYDPDLATSYHRILNVPNFYNSQKGFWTETNENRSKVKSRYSFYNEFSYPLNTVNKIKQMNKITKWANKHNVYLLGRWGTWRHINSDIAVKEAIDFFDIYLKHNIPK
jgi:protoporphyrinogen oxidase